MPLLRLDTVSLHYGTLALLDDVSLKIERGEKLGLLGRNGAGKTTLLKVIADDVQVDNGERWQRPGTHIAWLRQELPPADERTVYEVVASGLPEAGELLTRYHQLISDMEHPDLDALARVQDKLEKLDGWNLQTRIETIITRLELPSESTMAQLSGGWRRRVALGQALVSKPDVLLLDEPTNHLDIPAIEWLEGQLKQFEGALVLITHDRRFLQQVANVMAELDRGHLTRWKGDYQGFLKHREAELHAEAKANELFDRKLAQEEVWVRQGIKARRTRNEGRVRALKAMRNQRQERRERMGKADFSLESASRSGKIVAEVENISKSFGDREVISDFSTIIQRGDRIGIVGTNGAGKSTLVKLLLGELTPDTGTVELGTRLEVAYSDQLRGDLDPEKTLMDNVCGGQEFIEINGRRRHAMSYLSDFLFQPDRARQPVKALSGGEQNRAVLARLFSRPANLLVLDEPTNDLDLETLELLEEILLEFEGTVLLVSHDREFMDNVVTSLMVLDGTGTVDERVGSYSDWERSGGRLADALDRPRKSAGNAASETGARVVEAAASTPELAKAKPRKLSYNLQRELDALPGTIEKLEQQQAALAERMGQPTFFEGDPAEVKQLTEELKKIQADLEKAFERWGELETPEDA